MVLFLFCLVQPHDGIGYPKHIEGDRSSPLLLTQRRQCSFRRAAATPTNQPPLHGKLLMA
jgi:hypothetical protein